MSLALDLQALEASLAVPGFDDGATIESIYDALYRQYFDRPSPRRRTVRNDALFGRVRSLCLQHDVDPETYIAANMLGLRDWLSSRKDLSFQPTMLSGSKAWTRYRLHSLKVRQRFRHGRRDAFAWKTRFGRLRATLALEEQSVGEYYVRAAWSGVPIDWDSAIVHAQPEDVWQQFEVRHGREWTHWASLLGHERARQEKRLAQLRAARAVADSYRQGLSEDIAFTNWSSLADLIAHDFEPPSRMSVDFEGLPGELWSPV